jgi:hypothetical protein
MLYFTAIINGVDAINHYRKWGMDTSLVFDATTPFGFDSEQELEAFFEGVRDAIPYSVCEIQDVANDSLVSKIAFARAAGVFTGFTQRGHESVAQRMAYEKGVTEGKGLSDLCTLNAEDLDQFLSDVGWV